MRRKILKLYLELKLLEDDVAERHPPGDNLEARLQRLEERVDRTWLPISFRPLLYQLRMHISLVRERMKRIG